MLRLSEAMTATDWTPQMMMSYVICFPTAGAIRRLSSVPATMAYPSLGLWRTKIPSGPRTTLSDESATHVCQAFAGAPPIVRVSPVPVLRLCMMRVLILENATVSPNALVSTPHRSRFSAAPINPRLSCQAVLASFASSPFVRASVKSHDNSSVGNDRSTALVNVCVGLRVSFAVSVGGIVLL